MFEDSLRKIFFPTCTLAENVNLLHDPWMFVLCVAAVKYNILLYWGR